MIEPIRYAITGSRRRGYEYQVQLVLTALAFWKRQLGEKIEVLVGDADGVDRIAFHTAEDLGLRPQEFKADWDTAGIRAGHQRNQQMIDAEPKVLFAFKNDFGQRRGKTGKIIGGTEDCCRRALKAGIPVFLVKQLTEEDLI